MAVAPKIIQTGSVIPKSELLIILGSSKNNPAPINERNLVKNFLHKKYRGIDVETEITTDTILSTFMYPMKLSNPNNEKNNDKKIGHPLFTKIKLIGKFPVSDNSKP